MQFLADQNIANSTIEYVKKLGYKVATLREHGFQEAPDEEVLELAIKNKLILITFDQDFTNIINYPPGNHLGIIVLKIPSELPTLVNKALEEFLSSIPFGLSKKLVVLEANRYRVRE